MIQLCLQCKLLGKLWGLGESSTSLREKKYHIIFPCNLVKKESALTFGSYGSCISVHLVTISLAVGLKETAVTMFLKLT